MRLNLSTVLVVGLVLLVAGMGVGLLNALESRSEWKERAEEFKAERNALAEESQVWQDSAGFWKKRTSEADSAAQRAKIAAENARNRADSALRVLHEAEVAAEVEADSLQGLLIRQIRADLPPEVLELTAQEAFSAQQRQVVALRGQITEKDRVIRSQDNVIARQEAQIVSRDSVIAVQDSLDLDRQREIEARDRQIAELEEELKPGFFDFSTPDILRDAAFFAIGRASAEVF